MIGRCLSVGSFVFVGLVMLKKILEFEICWMGIIVIAIVMTLLYTLFDLMDKYEQR